MHFWLGNTPEWLYLYETRGDQLVLPFGTLRNILPLVNTNEIQTEFEASESIDYGCKVPLYDYQEKAVDGMYWKQYGILQSAAGSGKTQMAIELIAKKEKLTITSAKYDKAVKELATQYGYTDVDQFLKAYEGIYGKNYIKDSLLEDAVLQFLIKNCKQVKTK
jgi:superfamily II DNA or RNA helicase